MTGHSVAQPDQAANRMALLMTLYLPTLIISFCHGVLLPVLPLFVLDLKDAYAWVGIVIASEGLGSLIGAAPAGRLLRVLGRKRTLMLGIGAAGVATFFLAFATSIKIAILCQLVIGFSIAFFHVACHAYLAGAVMRRNRGKAAALYGGVNRIGFLIGPAAGGWFGAVFGLSAAILLAAAAYGLTFLLLGCFVKRSRKPLTSAEASQTPTLAGLWQALRENRKTLVAAGTGYVCTQGIRSAKSILIPLIGAEVVGLDVKTIGFVLSISSILDTSMFLPAGLLMDNWGRKAAIIPSFMIQAGGMALLTTVDGFSSFLIASCVIGFGNGIGSGSMLTISADLAPPKHRGEFLGLWSVLGDTGRIGTSVLVGGAASLLSLTFAAWSICGVGLLAVYLFAFHVPETLKTSSTIR